MRPISENDWGDMVGRLPCPGKIPSIADFWHYTSDNVHLSEVCQITILRERADTLQINPGVIGTEFSVTSDFPAL